MTEVLLDELLVVDFSKGVAGAYCCLLFRGLGAEVVCVEQPGGRRSEVAEYVDAGKKSITLDASKAEGVALLSRLAEHADVLLTDAALPSGLDYATLSRQNPRLVLTLITLPPSNSDGLFNEYFTGLNAFAATLLPLVNMSILGRGQQVGVDGAECLAAAAFVVDGDGQWPRPEGDESFPPMPFRVAGQAREALTFAKPGEHNDEVYCGLLGLSGEEMVRLKEARVI
jgi:crotonobetainyl-CoA:carnitine CoA-transferase CaiB-like acyl-CoA transferase